MTGQTVSFDSSSWSSIQNMISEINKLGCMQSGRTEDNEHIIFAVSESEEGSGEYDVLHTMVSQSNGWIRHNYYHPDGTVEELYEKE